MTYLLTVVMPVICWYTGIQPPSFIFDRYMINTTNNMKIFLDTADTELIRKYYGTGLIDGVTTNPTLIMKSGRDPEEVYQELIDMGLTDVSMEVVGNRKEMYEEGVRLSNKFGKYATIKVPCTPDGLAVCKELSRQLIRVNVTLIFSVTQAILSAKAGATYVSPFVGLSLIHI